MSAVKENMFNIINAQPEDSSYDEILRELAFHKMIEAGLKDSEENKVISNDEMKKKIKSWQK